MRLRKLGDKTEIRLSLQEQGFRFKELEFGRDNKVVTLSNNGVSYTLAVKKHSSGLYEFGNKSGRQKFKRTDSSIVNLILNS